MRTGHAARALALLLVVAIIAQPAMAEHRAGAALNAERPVVSAATVAFDLDAQRDALRRSLIDLGEAPEDAGAAVQWLTADDLAVLASNPRMLQRAGSMSITTETIIIWAVIIAGIVILFIVADTGFIVQN
jgi:hypothetical protein